MADCEGAAKPISVTEGPGEPLSSAALNGPHRSATGRAFSETNDNSVAALLTYGTVRILLVGDAEAREEEYMANGPYTRP